jgi:hypothetical protein
MARPFKYPFAFVILVLLWTNTVSAQDLSVTELLSASRTFQAMKQESPNLFSQDFANKQISDATDNSKNIANSRAEQDVVNLAESVIADVIKIGRERYPSATKEEFDRYVRYFATSSFDLRLSARRATPEGLEIYREAKYPRKVMPPETWADPQDSKRTELIRKFITAFEAASESKISAKELNEIASEFLTKTGVQFRPNGPLDSEKTFFVISPKGDTFANHRAQFMSNRLNNKITAFQPWHLAQKSVLGSYNPGSNILQMSIESILYDRYFQTLPHEMLHSYFDYLGELGIESPYHARIYRESKLAEGKLPYDEYMSFEELATHARDTQYLLHRAREADTAAQRQSFLQTAMGKASRMEFISFNTTLTLNEVMKNLTKSKVSFDTDKSDTNITINLPGDQRIQVIVKGKIFKNFSEVRQYIEIWAGKFNELANDAIDSSQKIYAEMKRNIPNKFESLQIQPLLDLSMRTKRLAKALIRPVSPLMIGCNELGFDSALRAFDPSI